MDNGRSCGGKDRRPIEPLKLVKQDRHLTPHLDRSIVHRQSSIVSPVFAMDDGRLTMDEIEV